MKKLVLLFVALIAQFAVASDVDLYRGLLFWIKDQKNIEGNELRQTTYPLSKVFDGSFNNPLTGTAIPKRDNQDYTFSLSFKVGELNCVNRLLVIGSHSIYLDTDNKLYYNGLNTTFIVDTTNKYYSLVFRVDESHRLTIYAGTKDQRLSQVMSSVISEYLNFSSMVGMSTFKLGYGSRPSTGNLQSGQFANLRFWTRALSDEECAMVDKSQNVFLETKPLGCPVNVKYDFFPLGGNMFGVDEVSTTPKCSTNISASGWHASIGRLDSTGYAMSSTNGIIRFNKFNDFFEGSYVLNKGKELSDTDYQKKRSYDAICAHLWHDYCTGYLYYPYPCYATTTSMSDATYSMWFRIDEISSNTTKLLERKCSPEKVLNDYETIINSNATLSVSITSTMKLCIEGSGLIKTTFPAQLNVNEWYHIALVGRSKLSLSLYLNGTEIGNISSPDLTLGYLPPIDGRYRQIGGRSRTTGSYDGMKGSVYDITAKLEIGGWNGMVDEIVFYGKALT